MNTSPNLPVKTENCPTMVFNDQNNQTPPEPQREKLGQLDTFSLMWPAEFLSGLHIFFFWTKFPCHSGLFQFFGWQTDGLETPGAGPAVRTMRTLPQCQRSPGSEPQRQTPVSSLGPVCLISQGRPPLTDMLSSVSLEGPLLPFFPALGTVFSSAG